MNQLTRKLARSCCVAWMASTLIVSAELPLFAAPQQATQQNSSAQPPDNSLPDAPQAQPAPDQQSQTPGTQPPPANTPSGAAGAKAAATKGAPAAQPAGAAVAPARERGHHSLLIKLGLLAGASVAIGSAVALSHGSPSRPPGASSTASRQ